MIAAAVPGDEQGSRVSINALFGSGEVFPEVLLEGYAPSEYRKKQWPEEALIEGWFPLCAREHKCFDLVEDVIESPLKRSDRHSRWRTVPTPTANA